MPDLELELQRLRRVVHARLGELPLSATPRMSLDVAAEKRTEGGRPPTLIPGTADGHHLPQYAVRDPSSALDTTRPIAEAQSEGPPNRPPFPDRPHWSLVSALSGVLRELRSALFGRS